MNLNRSLSRLKNMLSEEDQSGNIYTVISIKMETDSNIGKPLNKTVMKSDWIEALKSEEYCMVQLKDSEGNINLVDKDSFDTFFKPNDKLVVNKQTITMKQLLKEYHPMGTKKLVNKLKTILTEDKQIIDEVAFNKLLQEIEQLTADNYHTDARYEIAKFFKLEEFVEIYEWILKYLEIFNGLDGKVATYSYENSKKLFARIKELYGKDVVDQLYAHL